MEKPANTDYPIEEILRRRWSPRAFSERMVETEKLKRLFEAVRWAPSSPRLLAYTPPVEYGWTASHRPRAHSRCLSSSAGSSQMASGKQSKSADRFPYAVASSGTRAMAPPTCWNTTRQPGEGARA